MTEELEIGRAFTPPMLDPGEIHVWQFSLSQAESDLPALRTLLDDTERARADRFFRPLHGARFTVARATFRTILGAYAGLTPATLGFTYGENGKPELPSEMNPGGLHFNLSHSGDRGAFAIARGTVLGVDLEAHRPNPDYLKIARRFFAPDEVDQLTTLPVARQLAAFYQCWTAKEALVKAWGLGLTAPLHRFSVHVSPEETALRRLDLTDYASGSWHVQAVQRPAGYSASVAGSGGPRSIRHFKCRSHTAFQWGCADP